jgi:cellulose synthase operon protein YhjQ
MGDRQVVNDLNESPETTPASRSWTRQHGAKHRDYPVSRQQARERARQRVQRVIEEERERAREQAETRRAAGFNGEIDAAADTQQSPPSAAESPQGPAAPRDLVLHVEQEIFWPRLEADRATPDITQFAEDAVAGDFPSAPIEESMRPAWLNPQRAEMADFAMPPAPADTLQGARDRLASRWFALKGFGGAAAAARQFSAAAATVASPAPVLALFSLAGGVGKSSLAATLARTFSARGERLLLVETAPYGLLPFYFGANDRQPGVLRTFAPPEEASDAPVRMIALDAEALAAEAGGTDPLAAEINRCAQNTGRIIIDIATASTAVARRLLCMSPLLLVPLAPDMSSVVNAGFIDSAFHRTGGHPDSLEVYYVLNQFDPSLPLHLDVREVLRERLGDRLLPFALRRSPAVSEALAEGMTVVDYAPASPVAEDIESLTSWIRARSAPAGVAARGMRWIEK